MNNKLMVRVLGLALFLVLLYFIRGVLFPIVLAVALFYILNPLVNLLHGLFPKKFILGRDLAIITSFLLFGAVVLLILQFILPPFVGEFNQLTASLPQFLAQAREIMNSSRQWYINIHLPEQINQNILTGLSQLFNYLAAVLQQTAFGLLGLFSQLINLIIIPVVVYYALKDEETLAAGFLKLVPGDHQEMMRNILQRTNLILKNYVEGQFIICTLIGLVTGLGLYLFGINFYLILGFIAAVTEIIPIIGPILGAIPAVIVALFVSPTRAMEVIVFYLVVQTIGAYILAPKIMGNKLDLHPLTIVLAVLILGSLIGVWGVFFAAPITAILKIIYQEIRKT